MCGWDTDCNAGNVGCIVGTMVGLEGIDREKWLAPMNDGFAASNAIGCLGFIDAPWYARYLDDITRRLEGEPTDFAEGARVYDFELPGSTHGFESETARVANAGGCLKCESHGPAEVYRWTYHGPEWFTETASCFLWSPVFHKIAKIYVSVEKQEKLCGLLGKTA